MRVAIFGTGGLGAFFGGFLARAGRDVTFIARGSNLDALCRRGLTLKTLPPAEIQLDVRATDDPTKLGVVDLVWCCVKAYDLEVAAREMAPLVGPQTLILPIQNGVDAAERIAAQIGADRVLGGLCLGGATLEAPGVVAQKTTRVRLLIGELNGDISPRIDALGRELSSAGIDAEVSSGIRVALWDKFVGMCGTHSLTALMRLPVSTLFADPEASALVRGLMEEAEQVARATGVVLPEDTARQAFESYRKRAAADPSAYASIYYDLVAGRRLEVEHTNGAVVRLGQRGGIATPLNFAVYAALRPWVDGRPPTAALPHP